MLIKMFQQPFLLGRCQKRGLDHGRPRRISRFDAIRDGFGNRSLAGLGPSSTSTINRLSAILLVLEQYAGFKLTDANLKDFDVHLGGVRSWAWMAASTTLLIRACDSLGEAIPGAMSLGTSTTSSPSLSASATSVVTLKSERPLGVLLSVCLEIPASALRLSWVIFNCTMRLRSAEAN
jgi:hypothetical protein